MNFTSVLDAAELIPHQSTLINDHTEQNAELSAVGKNRSSLLLLVGSLIDEGPSEL